MLRQLFVRIFETIKESKQLLFKYNENEGDFTKLATDKESREHFSRIIENTIFLAGLTLYFPKYALYYVNKDVNFHQIYSWSNNFCSNLTFLDLETKELLNLAAQEIEIIPRSENFFNPYKDISKTVPIELICRCVNFGGEKHKKIKEINLGNNLLAELPQQFCAFFSELEVLNLGNNKIKALPEDFGSLSSLYHLDLSNNRIKKLPASFGDLDILKWLNLANNPLDGDLVEIIGECLDDYQCTTAAVNAVQYVGFSYAHSAESTAIIDDSSSIAPTNESSSNNSSPDFKEEIGQVHKRKKFRKMTTLSKSESKSIEKHKIEEDEDGFDSYFYGKFVMCKDIF
uniref:Uncharacterized protein n=1 Tax=Meloidogyne javanica TaxID=6303 RepID=A0A915MBJ7_MELJA